MTEFGQQEKHVTMYSDKPMAKVYLDSSEFSLGDRVGDLNL